MRNKIIAIVLVIFIIALWITWYVFKDKLLTQMQKKESELTSTWKTINEFITINYLPKFHHLDLRSKNLGKMPNICEMVAWTNYEYDIWSIDLADNNIDKIDTDLSCLKNLSELNFSFNKISKIENLDWLSFIKKLDLWNNEISTIAWLDNLKTLNDLHLWYNKITKTTWLEKLTNLISLKLQHNEIYDLEWVKDLVNLEELKLEFNKLEEIDLKQLMNLKKLKIITVWENAWIDKETIDKFNDYTLKNTDNSDVQEVSVDK